MRVPERQESRPLTSMRLEVWTVTRCYFTYFYMVAIVNRASRCSCNSLTFHHPHKFSALMTWLFGGLFVRAWIFVAGLTETSATITMAWQALSGRSPKPLNENICNCCSLSCAWTLYFSISLHGLLWCPLMRLLDCCCICLLPILLFLLHLGCGNSIDYSAACLSERRPLCILKLWFQYILVAWISIPVFA